MGAKTICAMLTVLVLLGMVTPLKAAAAEPKLTVESEIGYGGNIKLNAWGPLSVKLLSDRDISGELIVQTENPFTGTSSSYVERVDLTAGTAKTVQFTVLGNTFSKGNNSIRFYEGTAEKGKYIPFSTGRAYIQHSASSSLMLGVLAADPDTMNFLGMGSGSGKSTNVIPLTKEQLPESATALSTLDVIVMNNYSTDTLSESQVEAIRSWVKQGGTLVLAGGQGYDKTAKGFEDMAPVEYKGGTDVQELDSFEQAAGEPLALSGTFPVSSAVLKQGAANIISSNGLPLIAGQAAGKGDVFYAAYDISMDPVYHWKGHADLWIKVLREQYSGSSMVGVDQAKWNLMSGLSYVLDYFPSLTMPPFSLLFWILVLYAVLVAPLLYYVLKKLDRREWAWGLIPLIALIASASIYFAGTSGRSDVSAHTLNIIELDGQGEAVKSASSAVFVPRGGTYELEFAAGTVVSVERERNPLGGSQTGGADSQLIRVQADSTELTLREMTTRSVAKLWLEQPKNLSTGKIEMDLSFDSQGKLKGTVANQTNSDLTEAYIVAASQVYSLGELPRGKEIQLPATFFSAFNSDYGSALFPYSGYSQGSSYQDKERERSMINQYMNASGNYGRFTLLAWSKEAPDQEAGYTVNGKQPKTDYLNLWVQAFEPGYELNGEVEIPFGMIIPDVASSTATEYRRDWGNQMSMSAGEIVFEFVLPAKDNISYYEIQLNSFFNNNAGMQVWNDSTGEWEPSITGPADNYTQGGTFKMKYTTSDWTSFQLPEIMLKGRVAP